MMLPPDMQDMFEHYNAALTRRQFFRQCGTGLGVAALASLLEKRALGAQTTATAVTRAPWLIAPKARRAIYISLIGAPSQLVLVQSAVGSEYLTCCPVVNVLAPSKRVDENFVSCEVCEHAQLNLRVVG